VMRVAESYALKAAITKIFVNKLFLKGRKWIDVLINCNNMSYVGKETLLNTCNMEYFTCNN
jgi:hypothetical protein